MTVSAVDLKAASSRVSQSLALQSPTASKAAATTAKDTTNSTSSSSSTSDITSNDFLTLLVTEMKNQDPTQPTDPNAYIQQLVGVNSLQQLISINQELGAATGATSSSATFSPPSTTSAATVAATAAVSNQ